MARVRFFSVLGSSLALSAGLSSTAWAQSAAPAAPAPAPAPPAAAPPAAAAAPARRAVVSFQADAPDAVLESDASSDGKTSPWYVVCQTPCEKNVPANGNFRVSGPGFYPSRQFALPEGRDRVVVNGEMKTSSVGTPIALVLVGDGLFWLVAPTFLVIGAVRESEHHDGTAYYVAGGLTALTGAAIAITGVVMLIVHAQDKESRATVAKTLEPRVALPGGLALEQRGVVF